MGAKRKRSGSGPFESLKRLKDKLSSEEANGPPKKVHVAPESAPHVQPYDEAFLFHRLFAGVKPLDRTRGRVPKDRGERSDGSVASPASRTFVERAAQRLATEQTEGEAVNERLRALVDAGARFEVADDGRRVEGRRVDLPLDVLRRLRRGQLPIDARFDLHGMRVEEARVQLEVFLRTMRGRGERCVLVIHGKGGHSPQGMGVLRGEMAAWLSQGASSHHAAAFATAREAEGGEGAVYVLLRK